MGLKWVADHFQSIQILIVVFVVTFAFLSFRSNRRISQFKKREADRADLDRLKSGPSIADAKLKPKPAAPLALPGVRLMGEPHEILGIRANADEAEVMHAYKDAIKKYHPDRIQGDAKDQMKFYEEASAKINEAKEAMLKKIRSS